MQTDERHAGEEGVIRSDIAEMIDRAAAMSIYAFETVGKNGAASNTEFPKDLAERLAEQTYLDVLRYSLDECSCPCHQDHPHQP
jgi:hypothetical protein